MIKGDYDQLTELSKWNVCATHKRRLEVAWCSEVKLYALRCAECGWTVAIRRELTPADEYRAGAPTPEEFVKQDLKEGGNNKVPNEKQVIPFQLGGVPRADLATGQALSDAQIHALVEYAYKYGLDPVRGHVVMMYGQPYIGIDGYLYHAMKPGRPYSLQSRPMTTDEEVQYKVDIDGHNWLAKVVFTDTGDEFTGIGIVTHEEMTATAKGKPDQLRSPVVAAHPWQLGQKRAEWQALRRAFPIGESGE